MKCLEKDRSRQHTRRPTALARDLERYLGDEPVEACPPSAQAIGCAGLRAQVQEGALATTAAFALSFDLRGAVMSTLLAVWATSAETKAKLAEHAAAQWQRLAARLWNDSQQALAALTEGDKRRDEARFAAYGVRNRELA